MSGQALDRALEMCARLHAGQRRRLTGEPYATHPIELVKKLSVAGVRDERVLAAAALHDAVEDTPATVAQLREAFGADVARWVEELTKPDDADKAAYLASFADASTEALLVKLADRHSNVADWIAGGAAARAADYAAHAAALYDAVEARAGQVEARFGAEVARVAAGWVSWLRVTAADA